MGIEGMKQKNIERLSSDLINLAPIWLNQLWSNENSLHSSFTGQQCNLLITECCLDIVFLFCINLFKTDNQLCLSLSHVFGKCQKPINVKVMNIKGGFLLDKDEFSYFPLLSCCRYW